MEGRSAGALAALGNLWVSRRPTLIVTWVCVLLLLCLHMAPFTEGFRRTADEVEFLDASMQGWTAIWAMTEKLAVTQGRLGFWLTVPINALASYFADVPLLRVVYVAAHFCVLALFAVYVSVVLADRAAAPLLLVLVSLQPLCGRDEYMPPVAYPLQNTLPFIMLLVARCVIVTADRRCDGHRTGHRIAAHGLGMVAMLTTEYAFLLATSLMMFEHAVRFARTAVGVERPARRLSPSTLLVKRAGTSLSLIDVTCVAIVLAIYLGYRLLHPSTYEGNVLDGSLEVGRLLWTTVRHVFAGMSVSHDLIPASDLPWWMWLAGLLVFATTALSLHLSLLEVRFRAPLPLIIGACAAMILYVSFPIAANGRQQRWCLEGGACGYLDSRLSYLGVAVVVLATLTALARWHSRRIVVSLATTTIALLAALTFMDNWWRSQAMRLDAEPWERADLLACNPALQPESDALLVRIVDPDGSVPFHPLTIRAPFWRRILQYRAALGRCRSDLDDAVSMTALLQKLEPTIVAGQTVRFSRSGGASRYLGPGWSTPEPHGVWSDGPSAELLFVPLLSKASNVQLNIRFRPYFGPSVPSQRVDLFVDDAFVDRWNLLPERTNAPCCERIVDLSGVVRDSRPIRISFRIAHPRNPELEPLSPETRHLGIALESMTLGSR